MRYKNRDSPARQLKEGRLSAPVRYRCIQDVVMYATEEKAFSAGEPYPVWYHAGIAETKYLVAFDNIGIRHILLDPETDQEDEWFALHFKKEDSDGQ